MGELKGSARASDPALKDRFIALLEGGARVAPAARDLGLCTAHFYQERRRDPGFAARWSRALRATRPFRGQPVAWTRDRKEAFLAAFAETGSAKAAAQAIGSSVVTPYVVRRHDADFAAAWALVRRDFAERLNDTLIEGALHGFEEVTEADGREVRRTRRANPRMMLKVIERIEADRRSNGGRWVEITEESVARARDKLLRRLNDGGSLITMREACVAAGLLPPPPPPAAMPVPEPEVAERVPGRSLWE
ncbi:hypothetical protein [Glacieibacterium frigidum]|uniref:Uncharacterized protein n=1 Tax=Glacieibacterium frigidum TaxID=2593303 RepID=A0A552UJ87_9SPHN|nr:hypothetical protein [Glacieibacterium frigidum]TRW18244.1 hypothetical protein FMM06_09145 [Glacieibacterium frigidum]